MVVGLGNHIRRCNGFPLLPPLFVIAITFSAKRRRRRDPLSISELAQSFSRRTNVDGIELYRSEENKLLRASAECVSGEISFGALFFLEAPTVLENMAE